MIDFSKVSEGKLKVNENPLSKSLFGRQFQKGELPEKIELKKSCLKYSYIMSNFNT